MIFFGGVFIRFCERKVVEGRQRINEGGWVRERQVKLLFQEVDILWGVERFFFSFNSR